MPSARARVQSIAAHRESKTSCLGTEPGFVVSIPSGVGIKVYMDVVYNHTGEGAAIPNTGSTTAYPLYGMRGLDNSTYYELAVNGQGTVNAGYYDANGTGPDYNTYNHAAQNLIIDSLYSITGACKAARFSVH